jgi:hypothetical protein
MTGGYSPVPTIAFFPLRALGERESYFLTEIYSLDYA